MPPKRNLKRRSSIKKEVDEPKNKKRNTGKESSRAGQSKKKPKPAKKVVVVKVESDSESDDQNMLELKEVVKTLSSIEGRERKVKLLSELAKVDERLSDTLINFFEDDVTIPFLARYRKHLIQNKTAEELRELKNTYNSVCVTVSKAELIMKALAKVGKLSEQLKSAILAATSVEELDYLYDPYKDKKGNKLENARALGLEEPANELIYGTKLIDVNSIINEKVMEGKSKNEVQSAFDMILAHVIATNKDLLAEMRQLKTSERILVTSSVISKFKAEHEDTSKYELYFNFSQAISSIKPHQILAINRGVSKKVLSSEIVIPQSFVKKLHTRAKHIFLSEGIAYKDRNLIFDDSFHYAYRTKIAPMVKRTIRADLHKLAEKASLEVFANNLKWLLLSPPVRGVTVLAIDPGFNHGCKVAVVSPCGMVLCTQIINITIARYHNESEKALKNIISKYSVDVIAIGNGKGCREVEDFISKFIQKKLAFPLDISYMIISEQGASVYSCSKEAIDEFPTMDPNLISAVSLARRVLDPLNELVKIEPKHLGIGMYQHDLNQKKLDSTLSDVVSECVSAVGIDINTASKKLLRNIAGLNNKKADLIIMQRTNNGPFMNREEIKSVKSIGPKTFQQCAGFIRILPDTVNVDSTPNKSKNQLQPLDQTDIHPELYDAAYKITGKCSVNTKDLGTDKFINKIKKWISNKDLPKEAEELGISLENLNIIIDSFTSKLDTDYRLKLGSPIFQKSIKSVDSLRIGQGLSGRVTNVTHFGAFVDLGIGRDGLIPNKYMYGMQLRLGNLVQVKVMDIDRFKKVTISLLAVV